MFRPQQPQGGAREQGLATRGMPVRCSDRYCQHLHRAAAAVAYTRAASLALGIAGTAVLPLVTGHLIR